MVRPGAVISRPSTRGDCKGLIKGVLSKQSMKVLSDNSG